MDESLSPEGIYSPDEELDTNDQVSEHEIDRDDIQELHLELEDDIAVLDEHNTNSYETSERIEETGNNDIEETRSEYDEDVSGSYGYDEAIEEPPSEVENISMEEGHISVASGSEYDEGGEDIESNNVGEYEETDISEIKDAGIINEDDEGNASEVVIEDETREDSINEKEKQAEDSSKNEQEYSESENDDNEDPELLAGEEHAREDASEDLDEDTNNGDDIYAYEEDEEVDEINSAQQAQEEHESNGHTNSDTGQLPIIIDVADTEFLLVPFKAESPSVDVSHLVPLFDTDAILDLTVEEFFGTMRHNEDLNEIQKFSVEEELVLIFPQLDGLHITEDNVYSKEVTFNDFVSTFESLLDKTVHSKPLTITCMLTSQTRFITKFNALAEIIRENKGFESITIQTKSKSLKRDAESYPGNDKRQRVSIG